MVAHPRETIHFAKTFKKEPRLLKGGISEWSREVGSLLEHAHRGDSLYASRDLYLPPDGVSLANRAVTIKLPDDLDLPYTFVREDYYATESIDLVRTALQIEKLGPQLPIIANRLYAEVAGFNLVHMAADHRDDGRMHDHYWYGLEGSSGYYVYDTILSTYDFAVLMGNPEFRKRWENQLKQGRAGILLEHLEVG